MKKLLIILLYTTFCFYIIVEKPIDYKKTVDIWQTVHKDILYTIIADNTIIQNINEKIQKDRNIDISKLEQYDNDTFQNIIKEKIINKNGYHTIKNENDKTLINNISNNNIEYAINIAKHSLRTIPKTVLENKEKNQKYFDNMIEINVNFAEPIAIVHYNSNKKWAFVLTTTGSGWIETKYLALTSKKTFLKYLNIEKQNFIISIDKLISIKSKNIEMGTKLILKKEGKNYFEVYFPMKNKQGRLVEKIIKIKKNNHFHHGYLIYNANNLIKQIFKFKNTKYGWGEIYEGKPYDGYLISRIYRTFGFKIPEKPKKLQNISNNFELIGENNYNNITNNLQIGDLLYIKSHNAMLIYLGKMKNTHYVIHSVDNIGKKHKHTMTTLIHTFNHKTLNNAKTIQEGIISVTKLR